MDMIRRWGWCAGLGALSLGLVVGAAASSLAQEDESDTIEIVIEHSAFHLKATKMQIDKEAILVVRNLDSIEHGFTSPGFRGLDVRVESEGVVTYGKGIEGLYVGPGEEVSIVFTPRRSGKLTFRCDLHPNMTGEVLYLTVGAA